MSRFRTPIVVGPTMALLFVVLLFVVSPVTPASAVQPATGTTAGAEPRASLLDLEDEVMCPICGTLLGLSRAPAAERERVFIRELIRAGKTDQEIKDALVAEYGPQVLALPDDDEVNFWVYVVPPAGLILAAIGVVWAGLAWRRRREPDRPDEPAPEASPDEDAERLDRELADYDR